MKFEFSEGYCIEKQDELNWALIKLGTVKKGDNKGKETSRVIGHYHVLERALMALARRLTDAETLSDINSYIDRLGAITRHLQEATA